MTVKTGRFLIGSYREKEEKYLLKVGCQTYSYVSRDSTKAHETGLGI